MHSYVHAVGRVCGKIHGLLVKFRVVRGSLRTDQPRVAEQVVHGRALEHLFVLLRAVLAHGGLPLEASRLEGSRAPRAKAAARVEVAELLGAEDVLVPLRLARNFAERVGAESAFLVHVSKNAAVREAFQFRFLKGNWPLDHCLLLAGGSFLAADAVVVGRRTLVAGDGLVLAGESLVLGDYILAQLVCQNREHLTQLLTHLESLTWAFEAGDGFLGRLPVAEDALVAGVRLHVHRGWQEAFLVCKGHARHGFSVDLALRQGGVERSWAREIWHIAHVHV